MPIVIAVVAYLCLGLEGYLNFFWAKRSLSYPFAFLILTKIEWLLIAINAIYLLGWLWGIAIFFFLFFGGRLLTFPIGYLCLRLTGQDKVEDIVYSSWFFGILMLAALTTVNFFITPFGVGLHQLPSFLDSLSTGILAWIAGVSSVLLYLFIGLGTVATDYSGRPIDRPLYAKEKNVKHTLIMIVFWPIPLIVRKAMERRFRR